MSVPAARPDRRPWRRGRIAGWALLTAVLAAPLGDIAWRHERWRVDLRSVRFIDHPEKISAGAAAVTVRGYLVATIESDVDVFQLARAEAAYPQVEAVLCDSEKPLGAWFHPMPMAREDGVGAKPFAYAVLVPLRSKDADLSRTTENVCLRLHAATRNPLSWLKSKPIVVVLTAPLREQLAAYAHGDGPVELALDPACAPSLCEPDLSGVDLRP